MKHSTSITRCLLGAGLMFGLAAESFAQLPPFDIDPTVLPNIGPIAPSGFTADALSVTNSSELITLSVPAGAAAGTGTGSGWATFGAFSLGGTAIGPLDSGLLVDYGLYITFDISVALTGGSLGLPGSTYAVTQLDYKFYVDTQYETVANRTTFSQAVADVPAGVGTPATVTDNGAADILLAFGSVINGVADLNANGGTGLNTTNTFAVCTAAGAADFGGVAVPPGGTPFMVATAASCLSGLGDAFFDEPNPFYPLVFSAFNNTSQGVSLSADGLRLAINAAGRIDWAPVPEPGTLALASLALLGIGATMRKRKTM
jgi:hypothetical protein